MTNKMKPKCRKLLRKNYDEFYSWLRSSVEEELGIELPDKVFFKICVGVGYQTHCGTFDEFIRKDCEGFERQANKINEEKEKLMKFNHPNNAKSLDREYALSHPSFALAKILIEKKNMHDLLIEKISSRKGFVVIF